MLVGLDWVEPVMLFILHVTCSCIPMHTFFLFNILAIFEMCWDFSNCLSLSLPFSSVCVSLCLWHLNVSLFRPKTLFVLGHPFHLTLLLHLFSFVMKMPERPSRRTFLIKAFILNAKLSWRTSPTLTYPMSFIVKVRSHYVTSRSHIHPC